ncbi:ABC transporter substrate-binding protein [Paenibacillus hodogayensis]|uniref:ABC transporter substrate-binding protein n=1 Tax=Paenibacillus hodogayensis TaxID=279208 RepID=A0ABV5W8D8_9BACL
MSGMGKMRRTGLGLGIAVLLALAGWRGSLKEQATLPLPDNARKSLSIVYWSEKQFMDEYGASYKIHNPNVDIRVIPMMVFETGKAARAIENSVILEQKPDLIYSPSLVTEQVKAGKLLELTALMKQDQIELSQFSESALEALRQTGGGNLLSLSPTLQTAALYYNKTLFDRLQLPYPSDDMSWPSLLQLAKSAARTEDGKQLYGLDNNRSPRIWLSDYTTSIGAAAFSTDNREAKYTSPEFKAAFDEALDAFRSGAVYLPPETSEPTKTTTERLLRNKFIAGEAAMRIDTPGFINDLLNAATLGIPSFDWKIVTEPVDPKRPGQSSSVLVGDQFAIMSDSPNQRAAWEFLKFITGPDMAAQLAKTKPGVLSIRNEAIRSIEGRTLDPFYAHKPFQTMSSRFPQPLARSISQISDEEMLDILYGRSTVDAGLQSMQSRVQTAIHQYAMSDAK